MSIKKWIKNLFDPNVKSHKTVKAVTETKPILSPEEIYGVPLLRPERVKFGRVRYYPNHSLWQLKDGVITNISSQLRATGHEILIEHKNGNIGRWIYQFNMQKDVKYMMALNYKNAKRKLSA